MQPQNPKKTEEDHSKSEAFFRKLVLPEEDKEFRTERGWRWFRSGNIIDLVRVLRERGKLRDRAQ
jgi:hypothetical protein